MKIKHNSELNNADKAAFESAMKGVERLIQPNKHIPAAPAISTKYRKKQFVEEEQPRTLFQFSDYETLEPVSSYDLIEFFRPGIQHKIRHSMRRGQYKTEAALDLHGMTVVEARETLSYFLIHCQRKKIRHAIIIHGAGRARTNPILKNKLNHWLRQTEDILAFCSVKATHGSSALYVLLKSKI